VAVWIPVTKALRRYGPIVGPIVANKVRNEAQPYWQAYQHARRVGGYLGAWEDQDGKHWVVVDAAQREVVGAFPPMSRQQAELALEHLDPAQLQHHDDTVLAKLGRAPAKAREALPSRWTGDADR
jgi:hypothetical protein